jgi:hypothetical protein
MSRPSGRTAVMAEHAPAEVEADSPLRRLQRQLQYFPTPPWAARAGGELITDLDPGDWWAWEPACGEGHMAQGLGDYFPKVHATDIHDHGWAGRHGEPLDFLSAGADAFDQADWIITNPPFSLGADFVETGLRRARRGVAILCRLGWFDTEGRYPLFFGPRSRCDIKATFFERPGMQLGSWDPKLSTATAYAWFIWFKPWARPEWLRQLQIAADREAPGGFGVGPLDLGIPPGTKARLTRPDDARRFGVKSETPLFDIDAAPMPPTQEEQC